MNLKPTPEAKTLLSITYAAILAVLFFVSLVEASEPQHVFYSEKQHQVQSHTRNTRAFAKLTTGEVVEYTEIRGTRETAGTWDDYQYLGEGCLDHIETENKDDRAF